MDMCDRDGVPGAANQRTRFESIEVVDEMGDDHFGDLVWKAGGDSCAVQVFGGALSSRRLTLDLPRCQMVVIWFEIFIPTVRWVQRSGPFTWSGGVAEPDDKNRGTLGRPPSLVVGGIVNAAGMGIRVP